MTEQEETIAEGLFILACEHELSIGRNAVSRILRALVEIDMSPEECTLDVLRALREISHEYAPMFTWRTQATQETIAEWPAWVQRVRRAVAAKMMRRKK